MATIRRFLPDLIAILLLTVLCWLFFWRLLTPNTLNQQSLVEGDFSGQFVAFAQYQAVRLGQGQIPLWNPYNNGGHPFLADTQSAVFYPPRLLTIALLNLTGGSTPQRMYDALQKEMVVHTWLASLLMYFFVRQLTKRRFASDKDVYLYVIPPLAAGLVFAYGGYMTGYPQLQLAVMEAGIWIPLALLGIHQAIDSKIRWHWLIVSGVALALSFLAGHPQTTLFFIYLCVAYLAWRVFHNRPNETWQQALKSGYRWRIFILSAGLFVIAGAGIAAVQLIPGWEYRGLIARNDSLNFDALGNGFPFYDVLQIWFPGILSLWSPLYFGITGFALAAYALWRRVEGALFWTVAAAVGLGLSFGHGTIIYDIFYNFVPGFSLFREQERSAYIVAVAASVLVGLGTTALIREPPPMRYKVLLWEFAALAGLLFGILFVNWLIVPNADNKRLGLVAFSLIIWAIVTVIWREWRWRPVFIVGLIVFELFSFGRTNPNVESIPASSRLMMPPLDQKILADKTINTARVDGVSQNYGTLYGIPDIQGISPLRLATIERLLALPPARVWEAFAVRYVISEDTDLPVDSQIIAKDNKLNLHQLADPRPFVKLIYRTWIEPNDDAALGFFRDPSFDARNTIILPADPGIQLSDQPPADAQAEVTNFAPEAISIHAKSSAPAILSIALPYYPGWLATIDGQQATLLRADTAMSALALSPGDHTIQLIYQPQSFTVGAAISIITLIVGIAGFAIFFAFHRKNSGSS